MVPYVSVKSETGRLKRVLLHRPGFELEHFVPKQMEEMLFDEIPWLERMQEEHDAHRLRITGVDEGVVQQDSSAYCCAEQQYPAEAFAFCRGIYNGNCSHQINEIKKHRAQNV